MQDLLTISVPKAPKKFRNKDVSFEEYISKKNITIRTTLSLPKEDVSPEKKMV